MTKRGALACGRSGLSRARATLRQSNVAVAARLVRRQWRSYARALCYAKVWERGGEGPRRKLGPDNYINDINKKNWAALVRPIFLHRPIGNARGWL